MNNFTTVIIDNEKLIRAYFAERKYRLFVKKIGSGVVTGRQGEGIDCGQDCFEEYLHNTQIRLTPTPNPGFAFSGWAGDIGSVNSSNVMTLIMNSDKTVVAIFCDETTVVPTPSPSPPPTTPIPTTPAPLYMLTVIKDGNGYVEDSTTTINCGVNCIQTFPYGTQVILLEPTPDPGWLFSHWSGHGVGLSNRNIFMNSNKEVTAHFIIQQMQLTVEIQGNGQVNSNPIGINCNPDCHMLVNYGETIELTAVANTGYEFVRWEEDLIGGVNPENILMDDNKLVRAIFRIQRFTLTIEIVDVNFGRAESSDGVIDCTSICSHLYDYNSTVDLTAFNNPNYEFIKYEYDGIESTNTSVSVIVDQNKTVRVIFSPEQFKLTTLKIGNGLITSNPVGISCSPVCERFFDFNTNISLTAIPDTGWNFIRWELDLNGTQTTRSILINGNKTVRAVFEIQQLTLNVAITGSGNVRSSDNRIICPTTCQAIYNYGSDVILTATPDPFWVFYRWTGHLTGTANIQTLNIIQNSNVVAEFVLQKFELIVNKIGLGTITSSPTGINCGSICNREFDYNTNVILTANPATGYSFSHWTGSISGTDVISPIIIMDSNKTVTAHFIINQYTLTVSLNEPNAGLVTSQDGNISCPTVCVKNYNYNSVVILSAIANTHWAFNNWSGDLTGTNPSNRSITINSDKNVIANFGLQQYRLQIHKSGTGTGTVTSNPSGIDCGNTCQYFFDYNTSVALTAVPDIGSYFVEWRQDLTGTNPNRSVLMTQNRNVIAVFDITLYNLTVQTVGSGIVTTNPNGINCPDTCIHPFAYNQSVTLIANPNLGWEFDKWELDLISSNSSANIIMDSNKLVRAVFKQTEYVLTVNINGNGKVVSDDTHIDCPDINCSHIYYYNDTLRLRAIPDIEHHFVNWTGSLTGTQDEQNILITNSITTTANFSINQYTLNVTKEGNGSVIGSNINCGVICSRQYDYGTSITITATPSTGYHFVQWEDVDWTNDPSELLNDSITFILEKDKNIKAIFSINMYDVNITVIGSGLVTSTDGHISCDPQCHRQYPHGHIVNLNAAPNIGHYFVGWSGDLTGTILDRSITITENKNIIAEFSIITYLLEITMEGSGFVVSTPIEIKCGQLQIGHPQGEQSDILCDDNFDYYTLVSLKAYADVGYELDGCDGDYQSIDIQSETITVLMDEDKLLNIRFIPSFFLLQVRNLITEERGTIISDIENCINCRNIYPNDFPPECDCIIPRNYHVELLASPDENYHLTTWELEGVTINKIGKGYGSIYVYRDNGDLIITPDPFPGYVFCGWTGDYDELLENDRVKVIMNENRVLYACFSMDERILTINKSGTGLAYIVSEPGGIYYGNINQYTFTVDSNVLLLIYLQSGSQVISVTGDIVSFENNVITIFMDQHKTIDIVVDAVCYELVVENLVQIQNGTIYSYPLGIECGVICEYCMPRDEYIELQAVPDEGYQLQTWEIEGVKIHKAGFGFGSVYAIKQDNKLFVTPDPYPGYIFCGWEGDYLAIDENNVAEIIINPNHEVYCCFTIAQHILTINKLGDGNAYITSEPGGIYYGNINSYPFNAGSLVLITVHLQAGVEIESIVGQYESWINNQIFIRMLDQDMEIDIILKYSLVRLEVINLDIGDISNNKIMSYPIGIDCGTICEMDMPKDEYIELQAIPELTHNISTWELENIRINKIGDGFGTLYTTTEDNKLLITPDPFPGYLFSGWSGDLFAVDGIVAYVEIGTPKIVNCEFVSPYKTLTINKIATNGGNSQILSEPSGIDYGFTSTYNFKRNTRILLLSRLMPGTSKTIWHGDFNLIEENAIEVILDDDKVINVDYEII